MTLRDKPITEQIQYLARLIQAEPLLGKCIQPAMKDIALICANEFVDEQSDDKQKKFVSELSQYMASPSWPRKAIIDQSWRGQPAGLGDAGSVIVEQDAYTATMDTVIMVHIAQKNERDLSKIESRLNSLLDELGL